ncbi:MAG: hypothetical protein LBH02_01425 [Methanocalculaceae archaeon]|jgi:heterodisulfide reductase subunit A-like polyferredoxin|nr:hypothetical protein [Methanocalculaceae archaeon]
MRSKISPSSSRNIYAIYGKLAVSAAVTLQRDAHYFLTSTDMELDPAKIIHLDIYIARFAITPKNIPDSVIFSREVAMKATIDFFVSEAQQ